MTDKHLPWYRVPGWQDRPVPKWRTERDRGLGLATKLAQNPGLSLNVDGELRSDKSGNHR